MKTDAEKEAQKKYQNKIRNTIKAQLNCTIDRIDYNIINEYCTKSGMSKAQLIVIACKEYINKNDSESGINTND